MATHVLSLLTIDAIFVLSLHLENSLPSTFFFLDKAPETVHETLQLLLSTHV